MTVRPADQQTGTILPIMWPLHRPRCPPVAGNTPWLMDHTRAVRASPDLSPSSVLSLSFSLCPSALSFSFFLFLLFFLTTFRYLRGWCFVTLQLSDFNVFQITMGSNTWGIQIGWSMFLMVVFWICFSRFKHVWVMLEIRIVFLLYDIFILCGRIEDTVLEFSRGLHPQNSQQESSIARFEEPLPVGPW